MSGLIKMENIEGLTFILDIELIPSFEEMSADKFFQECWILGLCFEFENMTKVNDNSDILKFVNRLFV